MPLTSSRGRWRERLAPVRPPDGTCPTAPARSSHLPRSPATYRVAGTSRGGASFVTRWVLGNCLTPLQKGTPMLTDDPRASPAASSPSSPTNLPSPSARPRVRVRHEPCGVQARDPGGAQPQDRAMDILWRCGSTRSSAIDGEMREERRRHSHVGGTMDTVLRRNCKRSWAGSGPVPDIWVKQRRSTRAEFRRVGRLAGSGLSHQVWLARDIRDRDLEIDPTVSRAVL